MEEQNQMTTSKLRLGVFALVFAIIFTALGAGITLAAQSHMVNARNDLQAALSQLEAAETNKGGHRVNAINYTKSAINEVNLGIQYAQ
jgi:Flp pilus assembly protein TadG